MSDIYFIYDGECPVCNYAAQAFRIRQAVGRLHLVDARAEPQHPMMREINKRAISLDAGMVIFYQESFYHGPDALHLMGLIGTEVGWLNKMNAFLFRSKTAARICYPALRWARNLLLWIKGVPKIGNLT